MTIKKIKEVLNYFLAKEENFSFEKRMFLSSIQIGILTATIGTIVGVFLSAQPVSIFLGILVACLLFVVYYFVRVKGIFKPFVIPIIIISFITISLLWIFGVALTGLIL